MLKRAVRLREALNLLWTSCPIVSQYIVLESEWSSIDKLCPLLGHIQHISTILEKEDESTLSTAVMVFNLLADKMESAMEELASTGNKYDEALAYAIQAGRDKMVKHYSSCNWIYDVSLILDPRHKYASFDSTEWGQAIKDKAIKKFETIFRNTYFQLEPLEPVLKRAKNDFESEIQFQQIFKKKKNVPDWKKEIDRYNLAPDADVNENILHWWKINSHSFPNLAKMARDILATPASSLSAERFFSVGSLVMTPKRTSLKDMLKYLMCVHSWSKCKLSKEICECEIVNNS